MAAELAAARSEARRWEETAKAAIRRSEIVASRLGLLARATTILAASLDPEQATSRLARLVVPELAESCVVYLVDAEGRLKRVVVADADSRHVEKLRTDADRLGLGTDGVVQRVLYEGEPRMCAVERSGWLDSLVEGDAGATADQPHEAQAMVLPLRARGRILGAMSLLSDSERPYTVSELSLGSDLARRAAMAIDNAQLFQQEHDVAETLQRALLPAALPAHPGLSIAARYLPATAGVEVGGDFYDVMRLPDGRLALAVGDVAGHDLAAAALMGQLRFALRAYAWQGDSPSAVLNKLDGLLDGLDPNAMATVVYAVIDGSELNYTLAGHPPPLLRDAGGTVGLLREGLSVPLGAAPPSTPRAESFVRVERGSTLLLYTDGLVEERTTDLGDRLEQLRRAAAELPGAEPEAFCDDLLAHMLVPDERNDDVAMLALRWD